jgi:hypothetical protein
MSIETLDLTLDTRTTLNEGFTCFCEILILSQHLTELPAWFLYDNKYVKVLDMSKCTKVTLIPFNFCRQSCIEHLIWPPNIIKIGYNCLIDNRFIQRLNLSYCDKLTEIGMCFCQSTNIADIILPVSIKRIAYNFCKYNINILHLDLSCCTQLEYIALGFCSYTNIQTIRFPKSLQVIDTCLCFNSKNVQELDFSECRYLNIHEYLMCKVKVLKLYSIANIGKNYSTYCEGLHIYNTANNKFLNLSFVENLQNVYLPEGEYCIVDSKSEKYSNVNFWLGDAIFPAEHFTDIAIHKHSSLTVNTLAIIDMPLETV